MCLLYAQRGDQWEFCIEYQDQVIILLFHFVGRVSNDELRMGFSSNTKKMNFLLSGLWKHFIKYHWGVMDQSICWKPAPLCQDICHGERHPILFKSVTLRWRKNTFLTPFYPFFVYFSNQITFLSNREKLWIVNLLGSRAGPIKIGVIPIK